jgi:uncharacterized membrane protein YgcG
MRSRPVVQLVLLLMALMAGPVVSDAVATPSFPTPPPPGRFIIDGARLISSEDGAEIGRLADALLTETRYPISVVTIRSLAAQGADGYTIERYAAELLQSWRGDRHFHSYGMLLLIAAENRTARIQLGSAWGNAHDGRARKVMDRLILPAFRQGHFSAGILNGVRGFDAMGRQQTLPMLNRPSWMPAALPIDALDLDLDLELDQGWWVMPALAVGGLVVLVGLISLARRGRRSWAWAAAAFILGLFLSRLFGGGSAEASESGGGATGEW